MSYFKHDLGRKAKSKVSGMQGIITQRSECLYGCNRYVLQPKADKDGKIADAYAFDEDDIEVTGEGVIRKKKTTGGPIEKASR